MRGRNILIGPVQGILSNMTSRLLKVPNLILPNMYVLRSTERAFTIANLNQGLAVDYKQREWKQIVHSRNQSHKENTGTVLQNRSRPLLILLHAKLHDISWYNTVK
jgi:hypothetical protein